MDARKGAAVVIPAYNEAEGIPHLVKKVLQHIPTVIVVDDGSSDLTFSAARQSGAMALRHEVNMGKGAANTTGAAWCAENGYCPVVFMDADGQHPPEKIREFLALYEKDRPDLIIGTRMRDPKGMPLVRLLTNRFMSWFTSRLIGVTLTDTQSGFRLYGERLVEMHRGGGPFRFKRFEYESEVLFRAVRSGLRIAEIDIPTIYTPGRKSRINPVKDTIRWVRALCVIRKTLRG
jgi:glycosyltransferase involved in cell wall biosynthesis